MTSFNATSTPVEFSRAAKTRRAARWAAALLIAPTLLCCSCKSSSQTSEATRSANPYAQNDPQTPEEEAYYQDVYSGEWREQTNPFGTGPSVCKKTGTTKMPPHWATVPHGAKTLEQIRAEAAARKAATAPQYAAAPTSAPYSAQLPVSSAPQYAAQPTPPQTPTIEYPQAQAPIAPQTTVAPQYVSQAPVETAQPTTYTPVPQATATPTYAPVQPVQSTTPTYAPVNPQPAAVPTAPAATDYPVYTGASVDRASAWVVRGQEPDDDPFGDDSDDAEAVEPSADEEAADEEATQAAPAAIEPVVELKKENVKEVVAQPAAKADAPQVAEPQAASDVAQPAAEPERVGGKVLPLTIDPSLAKRFEGVVAPIPNPSAPANPNAPRETQDEYVVSGGDSKGPAYSREDWSVENVDKEDAVAHFDTIDGRILTEPSNKVFLYSPRFGAARQAIGPVVGEQNVVLESANSTTVVEQADDVQTTDVREQEVKLLGVKNAIGAEGTESKSAPSVASGRVGAMEADDQVRLGALLTSASVDALDASDAALLMDGSQAAQGWSGEQKVAVALDTVNAFSNIYVDRVETVFTVDDHTKTSKLRVIKIANKESARVGELVEFTLRFENIGDEPIGNVTIIDNLSARLRYVDNTARSSVPAEFLADLSESGSLVLRWEITDPLEPKEFGVVRFICKVK